MRRLLPLLCLLPIGCTAEVKEQLNDVEEQLDGLRLELAASHAENDRLQLELVDLERDLANYRIADAAGLDVTQDLWALIDTSMGNIVCKLFPARAPGTVANFVQLAEGTRTWTDPATGEEVERPLYPGTIFHRVVPGFAIQGGDPQGDGNGDAGYKLDDEFHPELKHVAGALSMAANQEGHNSSQFFVTELATPHLDGVHNVFGKCEPLALIKDIAAVPTIQPEEGANPTERPVEDVVIENITIHRGTKPR